MRKKLFGLIIFGIIFASFFSFFYSRNFREVGVYVASFDSSEKDKPKPILNKDEYDRLLFYIANNPEPPIEDLKLLEQNENVGSSTQSTEDYIKSWYEKFLYPVKNVPYPKVGALIPFNRIIAYYGNFYSTQMGILGQYDEDEVVQRLLAEVEKWTVADPEIPALPAIHYIAGTAQDSPGEEGFYTLRMPDEQIDHALKMAEKVRGILFLDLQIGLSDIRREVTYIEDYLKLPQVHIGIDPEFSMKTGHKPGTVIGYYTDDDINFVIDYLSKIVKENDLPPKILVLHRFTKDMIRNYQNIKPTEEVQVVVHMDGWGSPARKFDTYNYVVVPEPIQFTGFKIFYKNDLKEDPHQLLTPNELLNLRPVPIYIQYQ